VSNGEIRTDLGIPSLEPSPSVGSVSEHFPNQNAEHGDAERQARRRSRSGTAPEDESSSTAKGEDEENEESVVSEASQHQIDRMA
jgi:hypothetical protein